MVVATGPFYPAIPPIAKSYDDIFQIHSSEYKNPQQLPEGNVLVVGAGFRARSQMSCNVPADRLPFGWAAVARPQLSGEGLCMVAWRARTLGS